jgi:hypothetical protein
MAVAGGKLGGSLRMQYCLSTTATNTAELWGYASDTTDLAHTKLVLQQTRQVIERSKVQGTNNSSSRAAGKGKWVLESSDSGKKYCR